MWGQCSTIKQYPFKTNTQIQKPNLPNDLILPVLISKLTSFTLKSETNDYKLDNTYFSYDHSTSISNLLNVQSFGTVVTLMIKYTLMMSKAIRKAGPALQQHHKDSWGIFLKLLSSIMQSIKCGTVVTSLRIAASETYLLLSTDLNSYWGRYPQSVQSQSD